jgi:hypothetical protein
MDGRILKGTFSLVKMKGRGEKNWLLMKKNDSYARKDWSHKRALTKEKESRLREKEPPCEAR